MFEEFLRDVGWNKASEKYGHLWNIWRACNEGCTFSLCSPEKTDMTKGESYLEMSHDCRVYLTVGN